MANNILNHMASREFFLNADFDAVLRGGPSLLDTTDATYLHEMAWHYLFAGTPGDSLIVHRPLPGDFLAYLSAKGMEPPRQVLHPGLTPDSTFMPFGWNAQSESLSLRYAEPPPHPDLRIVKIANSRAFSLEIERDLIGEEHPEGGHLFVTLPALEGFLALRSEPLGWVVKGDHGHAGTANLRVPSGPPSGENRARLVSLFRDHGRVVAEPWQERLLDMSVSFRVGKLGMMSGFRGHALLNSRDGAFLGVKILPSHRPPEPWDEPLEASAGELAKVLDALGYYGPVGVDAYVWNSPQGPKLRTIVDINARLSMALPAHGLADRLPGKTLLWMWSKPRKLNLPFVSEVSEGNVYNNPYTAFDAVLGRHAFDPVTCNGILAVSPLALPEGQVRPKRTGFLFSADDEAGLGKLQAAFSRSLGRA